MRCVWLMRSLCWPCYSFPVARADAVGSSLQTSTHWWDKNYDKWRIYSGAKLTIKQNGAYSTGDINAKKK